MSNILLKTANGGTIDMERIIDVIVENTSTLVTTKLAPVLARLEAIEKAGTGLTYRGIYSASQEYARGHLATHAGALWHANGPTNEKPGTGSGWTMMAKGA